VSHKHTHILTPPNGPTSDGVCACGDIRPSLPNSHDAIPWSAQRHTGTAAAKRAFADSLADLDRALHTAEGVVYDGTKAT
jgi:hypothetical protein